LFLGKALANFVLLMALEADLPAGVRRLLQRAWTAQFGACWLVLALGTWGMTVVGTVFSALTVNLRLRELMLPMLIYPMLIPALMAAMQLTTAAGGEPLAEDDGGLAAAAGGV
jgi:heme exporter protein B